MEFLIIFIYSIYINKVVLIFSILDYKTLKAVLYNSDNQQ